MRSETAPAVAAEKRPSALWAPAEIELLRELAAQGQRIASVALRLGRSYDSVRFRARKEGIRFASFGSARRAAVTAAAAMSAPGGHDTRQAFEPEATRISD